MFSVTIPLKQHTPLIHFQHEQEGATLRATELKPKLDRFIVEELAMVDKALFERYKEVITPDNFPFDKDNHIVSPYKIVIKGDKKEEFVITSQRDKDVSYKFSRNAIANAPYFADNKNIKDGTTSYKANDGQQISFKKGIMSINLTIEIKSFDEHILALIKKCLPYVLTYENFGTRQNKGFGSFHLEGFTVQKFEEILKKHPKYRKTLCFTQRNSNNDTERFKSIFEAINNKYTLIKTGKTYPKVTISKLLSWFPKSIDWEKKIVRQYVVLDEVVKDYSQNNNYKYIRALLGLAQEYVYNFDSGRPKVKIKCIDKDIERFKSPLTFKVFENSIFVLPQEIDDEIFDATFEFYIDDDKRKVDNKGKVTIKTPPKYINGVEIFNLINFLENQKDSNWKYE